MTGAACVGGSSTHRPECVFFPPERHSAKRLYTSSVPLMRVYGFTKHSSAVARVTWRWSAWGGGEGRRAYEDDFDDGVVFEPGAVPDAPCPADVEF